LEPYFFSRNQVTDGMAKLAMEEDSNFHVFDFVPNFVLEAVRAETAQICLPRGF